MDDSKNHTYLPIANSVMISGLVANFKTSPERYVLGRYLTVLGLLEMPIPPDILNQLLTDKPLALSAADMADALIYDNGTPFFTNGDVDGFKGLQAESAFAASLVCKRAHFSRSDFGSDFEQVLEVCIPSTTNRINEDNDGLEYARLVLHKLSKGRGLDLANFDGMKEAFLISKRFISSSFVGNILTSEDVNFVARWAGTIGSIFHDQDQRTGRRSLAFPGFVVSLISRSLDILKASDISTLSPRAFSTLGKAIRNIGFKKEEAREFSRSLIDVLSIDAVLAADFRKNGADDVPNMQRRLNSSIDIYVSLQQLATKLEFIRKMKDPEGVEKRLRWRLAKGERDYRREALDALVNIFPHLPEGAEEFSLGNRCQLKTLSLAEELEEKIDAEKILTAVFDYIETNAWAIDTSVKELLYVISQLEKRGPERTNIDQHYALLYERVTGAVSTISPQTLYNVTELIAIKYVKSGANEANEVLVFDQLEAFMKDPAGEPISVNFFYILSALINLARFPKQKGIDFEQPKLHLELSIGFLERAQNTIIIGNTDLFQYEDVKHLFWGIRRLGDWKLINRGQKALKHMMHHE